MTGRSLQSACGSWSSRADHAVVAVEDVDRAPRNAASDHVQSALTRPGRLGPSSGGDTQWPARHCVLMSLRCRRRSGATATTKRSDLLGPDYEMARHASRSADGVGAVLASRWPFGSIREVDLHVTERVDDLPWAAAVTAEVLLPEPFGLTLFAHHKPTYQVGYARERKLQAVASARFVETQVAGRDLHVVLLGDFDDTPDSASVRFFTGRQSLDQLSVAYRDAGRRPTRVNQGTRSPRVTPWCAMANGLKSSAGASTTCSYAAVHAAPHCRSSNCHPHLRPGGERGLGQRPLSVCSPTSKCPPDRRKRLIAVSSPRRST